MTRLAAVAVGSKVLASIENADRVALNRTQLLVTPTSVANGTIGTYGAVTFSAVTSVSLNGIFTSEFDWYALKFSLTTSGASALGGFLRLAGTDAATAYDSQRTTSINTTVTAAQSLNAANFVLDSIGIANSIHSGTIELYNPALATATSGTIASVVTPNPMTTAAGTYTAGLLHRTTTAYDGFSISVSVGTMTGTIRAYGII